MPETGDVVHFGSVCATRHSGRKFSAITSEIETRQRAINSAVEQALWKLRRRINRVPKTLSKQRGMLALSPAQLSKPQRSPSELLRMHARGPTSRTLYSSHPVTAPGRPDHQHKEKRTCQNHKSPGSNTPTDDQSNLEALLLKIQRSRRYCSADMGRIVEFSQHSWYLSAKVSISKKAFTRTTRGGTTNTLVSCRVLMVASRILWISNAPDSGEPAICFQAGNMWHEDVLVGKWASPQAIELSSLHGGPTGLGRCDGWSVLWTGPELKARRKELGLKLKTLPTPRHQAHSTGERVGARRCSSR